jgi:hypothetical protein
MNTAFHSVGVPFPQAFTGLASCWFPSAPRYRRAMAYPTYQRPVRNICPLGENARLSIKRDSYADFSLCANWPILLGSLDIFYLRSRKTAIAQPLSLVTTPHGCKPGASGMTRLCRPTAFNPSSRILRLPLWSRWITSPQWGHS